MSRSKNKSRHYMDEDSTLSLYRQIRKPMLKPGRVMKSNTDSKWDWRDVIIEGEEND